MMHHCQITCNRVAFTGGGNKKTHNYPVARQSPGGFQQRTISRNDLKELYLFSCWRKHLCILIASLYAVLGMWSLPGFFHLSWTFWLKYVGGRRGWPNPVTGDWILAGFSVLQLEIAFTCGPTSLVQLWRTGFGHLWSNENMPGKDNTGFFFFFCNDHDVR